MSSLSEVDIERMRAQLFFEGPERNRRLSRFWLLLPLAAVIASAGVVSDSTATVIGAMIVAPLMTPILGIVLGVVLADRANLRRCVLLVVAGAAAVVAIGWLMGLFVPYPVVAATNSQVAARVTPRIVDLVAALATGAVRFGRPGPGRYLRHAAGRGHRHLAGAAAGRGRADPGVRCPRPVPGRLFAVRHQRRRHPGQRHRGHRASTGSTSSSARGPPRAPATAAPSPSSPPCCWW